MKHEEEKRVTGNKIQHAKKDLTYHGTYGWLFKKNTVCFKMFRARKFENFGPGLCVKKRHGMWLSVNGMAHGADLVVHQKN